MSFFHAIINQGSPVSAGSDQTINSGDTVQLAGSGSGTWTSSGTGSFNDASLPNAIYTPSVHDIALGVITLTRTRGAQSDSMSLSITVTSAYVLTLVDRYWDADDATDSSGNLTGWLDRKASATTTNIGTPTVTSNAINGHKAVNTNGTSSALATARVAFKSVKLVAKYGVSGSRLIHIPASNASTNFHAGMFLVTGSSTLTLGMSGDNRRPDYTTTAPETDADVGDNVFYNYSVRNIYDFRRNILKAFPVAEVTTTDTSSTATNMFIGCRRLGNNTGTADQFAKMNIAAIFMRATEWTFDESTIIDRYISSRWATVAPAQATYKLAMTATPFASNPLSTGHSSGGGAGNYYPPAVVKSDQYYVVAKSKNNTGCFIRSSDNGATWPEISGEKISDTTISSFNGTYAYRDGSLVYNGSTYYSWYVARNVSGIESIGLATATDPTATWTIVGQKLTAAQVNSALGTSYINLGSAKIRRHNGQYYLFVSAYDSSGGDIVVCTMSSIDGGTITPVRKVLERNPPYWTSVYSPSIIEKDGQFVMAVMLGNSAAGAPRGERNIYLAFSSTIDQTYTISLNPLVEPRAKSSGVWDERWAYDPEFLVTNDGNWLTPQLESGNIRVFQAGASWPVEVGLMGYVDVDSDLYETVTI